MEVIENARITTTFGNLNDGDVFRPTQEITTFVFMRTSHGVVNLVTGEDFPDENGYFVDNDQVTIYEATLHIK